MIKLLSLFVTLTMVAVARFSSALSLGFKGPSLAVHRPRVLALYMSSKAAAINPDIKKNDPKVVDKIDSNELEKLPEFKNGQVVMCRCWRSAKFPYCDGAHAAHNKETGDNVGPLIISKK